MQFQADLLGVPVDRPALIETTAAGAACLAGLATGVWNSPADLEQVRSTERRFEPAMGSERREALYSGWRRAVKRVSTARDAKDDD
jgi:glycerol kinase